MKFHTGMWRISFLSSSAHPFRVLLVAYPSGNTYPHPSQRNCWHLSADSSLMLKESCTVLLCSISSCCLLPHTLPGAGKRSRSRTAKGSAFYWNSWSRLSFHLWQIHLLLQMASCPRQPPTMTNARHSILLETSGKVF